MGVVAVGWFEKQEYDEWKEENPSGSFEEYSNEIIDATSEVAYDIVDSYCKDIGEYCESLKGGIPSN